MSLLFRVGILSLLLSLCSVVNTYAASSTSDDKKGDNGHHTDHPPHDHPIKTLKKGDNSTHRRRENKKLN